MTDLPYRTGRTWLTDDHLILLDVLFRVGVSVGALRRDIFRREWNLRYGHGLDDDALAHALGELCERGVLESEDGRWFHMTPAGGAAWSEERCPAWDRFCCGRWAELSRGRDRMTVLASSAWVRDDFLAVWPEFPIRSRTAVIADAPLLPWRSFPRVYVGIVSYEEPRRWSGERFEAWLSRGACGPHRAFVEQRRSWWGTVEELQQFVPGAASARAEN